MLFQNQKKHFLEMKELKKERIVIMTSSSSFFYYSNFKKGDDSI